MLSIAEAGQRNTRTWHDVDEIAAGIHRIAIHHEPWRSTVNLYVIADREPMLISTGLRAHFAQSGTVVSASIVTDQFSGQSRGFGFVEMTTAEEAQRAISELNGKDLDGRKLTVNLSTPKAPGSGGGGPRGGGRPGGGYLAAQLLIERGRAGHGGKRQSAAVDRARWRMRAVVAGNDDEGEALAR